ncbi:trypsin-like peptidase domain-containing protein [Phycisphaeraceae bacterium D3-23]
MKLHCKVVSGYQAGLDRELDRDTVLISRDEKADLQLHPTKDLQVGSQQHVKVVRDGDGFVVHCQHDNGLTVITGGKTTQLGQGEQIRFTHDADLVLGKDGPRIRCIAIASDIPATVTQLAPGAREQMPVSEVSSATVHKAEQSSHRILTVGLVAFVLVAAVAVGSFFAFRSAGKKADDTISALEDEIDDQAEDHERDLRRLNRAMDENLDEMTAMQTTIREIDAEVRSDFTTVLREHTKSVASVGLIDSDGLFTPGGTGWVVEEKTLATNAHVVEGLRDMYNALGGANANLRAVARFSGESARDVEIDLENAKSHPGYAYFFEFLASHMVDPQTGSLARYTPGGQVGFFQVGNAYDVGLLPTFEVAGPPLPLAKEDDLRALGQGTEIAYIGYPAEGLIGARINTPADMHIGRLSSMTNFASEADRFETALILTHSLPTVGGSSGSPIFSKDGKVIGLISHGSIMQLNDQAGNRTRIGLGFNYGQRVTMLRDLLAGAEVKEARRLREEEVRRQFAGLDLVNDEDRAKVRCLYAARNLLQYLQDGDMLPGSTSLNIAQRESGTDTLRHNEEMITFPLELKPGDYIAAVATGGLLDIGLLITRGDNIEARANDYLELSAEAAYFRVPGAAGGAAVQYDLAVVQMQQGTIDHAFAINIFPVE